MGKKNYLGWVPIRDESDGDNDEDGLGLGEEAIAASAKATTSSKQNGKNASAKPTSSKKKDATAWQILPIKIECEATSAPMKIIHEGMTAPLLDNPRKKKGRGRKNNKQTNTEDECALSKLYEELEQVDKKKNYN